MNMKKTYIYIITLLTMAFLTSCSSSSDVIDEEQVFSEPLKFSQAAIQSLRTTAKNPTTSDPLQQGFIINAWKDYQLDNQKTVMDNYEVKFKAGMSVTVPVK